MVTLLKAGEVPLMTYIEVAAEESGSTSRAVMVDITERKQVEERLRRALAEMPALRRESHGDAGGHEFEGSLETLAEQIAAAAFACRVPPR